MKKAKELLNLLEPSFTASGEAWMSWRTEGPPISPTPKALSQSHFNAPGPLDGSASSISTASTSTANSVALGLSNGSLGTSTSTSNGNGSSSNGNGGGGGLTGRVRNLSSLSLSSLAGSGVSEPPTPTSGSGVSPKGKPSAEEEARRRLVKCLRRMRDMLYGGAGCNRSDKEPCTKEARVRLT